MRHKNNKSISFVLAIILMVNCMFLVNPFEVKAADHGLVVDCVPKEVEQYVVDNKQKVIESIKELSDFLIMNIRKVMHMIYFHLLCGFILMKNRNYRMIIL